MSLDDNVLEAFCAILPARRSTLALTFKEMATIYDPPSTIRNRFVERRRGETESPLAFRNALLSLAQAAFLKLGPTGVDSLVMDRLLRLAKELNVSLPASEDDDLTSFVIARCIQSHLGLKKCSGLVTCATPAGETSEEDESAPVFATVAGAGGQKHATEHQERRDRPPCYPLRPGSTRGVCFNCGWPGHVAVECRTPRRGRPGPPSSSPHPPSTSKSPQTAVSIAEAFLHGYVLDKGAPECLLTEQGGRFYASLLKKAYNLLGTEKLKVSPSKAKVAISDLMRFTLQRVSEEREASRQYAYERLRGRRVSGKQWVPGDGASLHCPQSREVRQLRMTAVLNFPPRPAKHHNCRWVGFGATAAVVVECGGRETSGWEGGGCGVVGSGGVE
ncbi:unnamed protein product [Lampetra planeri]